MEGGGIFPEAPKLDLPSLKFPPKHPSFLAFLRARAWCPPFKCKELRPASWAYSGARIGLEINVAVPARPGKVGAAPREGGTRCRCVRCLAPSQEGGPGGGRAGRSWLPQPMCPAGQGMGSPRLWCPSGLPGPRPLKWPFGYCPWPPWAENRLRPLTSQFFLSTSVTQGLNCPILPGKPGTDRPGGGWGNLPPELP